MLPAGSARFWSILRLQLKATLLPQGCFWRPGLPREPRSSQHGGRGSISGELFKNRLIFTALRHNEELASRCRHPFGEGTCSSQSEPDSPTPTDLGAGGMLWSPSWGRRLQPELSLLPAGSQWASACPFFSWAALRGQQDRLRQWLLPQEERGILPYTGTPSQGSSNPISGRGPQKDPLV